MDTLGLYLSIPFCKSKCTYCNFASGVFPVSYFERYVERLQQDMRGIRGKAAQWGAMLPDQLSILRALARLLDPDAGPEIERIAATLGRDDVRRALEGLHECIGLITALTPLAPAVERAIADLQSREADVAAREAWLVKRETAVKAALHSFHDGEEIDDSQL